MRYAFEVGPGIVTDETLFSSPGRWSDANNARFRFGRAEPVGGYETYNATDLTGVCRNILPWRNNMLAVNIAFGTHTKLQVEYDGTIYDITPTGLPAGYADTTVLGGGWGSGGWGYGYWGYGALESAARTWSFANWGENLVGNPRGFAIYIWTNDTSAVATEITQGPDSVNCILIPPDSRQIRAFGCTTVAGTYGPSTIRGCKASDYTDWTPGSDDTGFEVTIEGGDAIVRALTFGDTDAIWTTEGVHVGQYVGGVQKYRVDKIAANYGLAGPNAACVHNRVAYWLTPDLRFIAWPYGGTPQEIPCPISRDFKAAISRTQIAKVVCNPIAQFGEIKWIYPDATGENRGAVIYAVDESQRAGFPVWSKDDFARTAMTDNGVLSYPLMIDVDGNSYLHEKDNDANGSALSWYVTSSAQYFDEDYRFLMRGIWPDIEAQQGNMTLTVSSYDYPQDSSAVTYGPYTLTANANKYDFMGEGRLVTLKFAGNVAGTFGRIGKPVFDVERAGKF